MAVKSNFDARANLEELMKEVEKIHQLIIEAMDQAGDEFVTACRLQPGDHAAKFYEDKTGHLRHSSEYFIYYDGEPLKNSGSDFTAENRADIQDLIRPKGFQLIGIAGMNYATIVESKGYNVASIQKDKCIVDLTRYVKGIEKYING